MGLQIILYSIQNSFSSISIQHDLAIVDILPR